MTYTLKVTLRGTKPPIWRRFDVPASITLADLHHILQTVMGWYDGHLHEFEVDDELYGDADPDLGMDRQDERSVTLSEVLTRPKSRMIYEYDFGDSWTHDVVLESASDEAVPAPRVLAARGACPPEDCGGVGGFYRLLHVLRDPKHPEHHEMTDWIGRTFDPGAYDLDGTNAALAGRRLRPRKTGMSTKAGRRRSRREVL